MSKLKGYKKACEILINGCGDCESDAVPCGKCFLNWQNNNIVQYYYYIRSKQKTNKKDLT